MSPTRTAIALALILAATRLPLAIAQDPAGWIGKRVVLPADSVLKDDKGGVNEQKQFHVYKVDRVDGPRLWPEVSQQQVYSIATVSLVPEQLWDGVLR